MSLLLRLPAFQTEFSGRPKTRCLFLAIMASFFICRQSDAQILVLGTAQDGGYPHAGCKKECCKKAWNGENARKFPASLALVDSVLGKWWLFEATPDFKEQLQLFDSITRHRFPYLPEGIFITHAHIGHYSGLMQLGREVMGARKVAVYAMPRMDSFLRHNGPWSQLVTLQNIVIHPMKAGMPADSVGNFSVTPFLVPHRDEYSETCGFSIQTSERKYLFIPDIDKWQKWDRNIQKAVLEHDIAFIDGTFSDASELPGRDLSEIPHPFFSETLSLVNDSTAQSHIRFIHMNHTNRALWDSAEIKRLAGKGILTAQQGMWY